MSKSTIKAAVSGGIVSLCVAISLCGIFAEDTNLLPFPSYVEFFGLIVSMYFLACNEASQVAIIKLQGAVIPESYKCAEGIRTFIFPFQKPSRLSDLFIGQTLQVVFLTFILSGLLTFTTMRTSGALLWLSASGLAGVCIVSTISQLFPSTVANVHPAGTLQKMPLIKYVVHTSVLLARCGIAHVVYLLIAVIEYTLDSRKRRRQRQQAPPPLLEGQGEEVEEVEDVEGTANKPPTDVSTLVNGDDKPTQDVADFNPWQLISESISTKFKVGISTVIWIGCIAGVLVNIIENQPSGIPWAVSLILLCLCLCIIFCAEGLKVAVVGKSRLSSRSWAEAGYNKGLYARLQVAASEYETLAPNSARDGNRSPIIATPTDVSRGVDRFLVGRQLIVVPCGFLVGRLCPGWAMIPGVIVVSCTAQLLPQILAARHPLAFLGCNSACYLVQAALMVESTGLAEIAVVLQRFFVTSVDSKWLKAKLVNDNDSPAPPGSPPGHNPTCPPRTKRPIPSEGSTNFVLVREDDRYNDDDDMNDCDLCLALSPTSPSKTPQQPLSPSSIKKNVRFDSDKA